MYKDDDLVDSKESEVGKSAEVTFTDLDIQTDYQVVISGPYDLDGNGELDTKETNVLATETFVTGQTDPIDPQYWVRSN